MPFIIVIVVDAFYNIGIKHKTSVLWSRPGSNWDLKFRKLLFYPLNYKTNIFNDFYSIPVRTAFCRAGPSEKCSAGRALNYKTNIFLLGKDNCTKPKKNHA
jgi:hypothetical protein